MSCPSQSFGRPFGTAAAGQEYSHDVSRKTILLCALRSSSFSDGAETATVCAAFTGVPPSIWLLTSSQIELSPPTHATCDTPTATELGACASAIACGAGQPVVGQRSTR